MALRPSSPGLGLPLIRSTRSTTPLTPVRDCLTCDVELFLGDLGLQVDPAPLLRVVHPAEAGDVYHALLVHVHITGCESREQRVRLGVWPGNIPPSVFWLHEQK